MLDGFLSNFFKKIELSLGNKLSGINLTKYFIFSCKILNHFKNKDKYVKSSF